jgi:hypothetical protein
MIRNLRKTGRVLPVTLGCAALLVALGTYSAHAQTAKPIADPQLDQLRQQVATLERRIVELEKGKGGVLQGATTTDAARAKTLEERLASLERAQESKNAESSKAGAQTVRAPFVVQDAAGKTLFKVDVVPGDNRALVQIGDPKGAHVHLGPNQLGGSTIGLYDKSNIPSVYLVNTPTKSYVSVVKGDRASTIFVDDKISSAVVYNAQGIPAGTMQAGESGAGRLKISNANGEVRIDAGITADDVGWVRADGPGGGGVSTVPGVPHSWIKGLKK